MPASSIASPVILDGAYGEGGGALIRTALTLAALTQQAIRIENVRGGTRYAGLDAEDLTLLKALREMTNAEVTGAEPGEHAFTFAPTRAPRRPRPLIESDRTSSGRGANAPILLSVLAPVLASTGTLCEIGVTGETFGTSALGADGLALGTLEVFRAMGLFAETTLRRAGFGRESDGRIEMTVEPSGFTGLVWTDRGGFEGLRAAVTYANLPRPIAERGRSHLERLAQTAKLKLDCAVHEVSSESSGISITVAARYRHGIGVENKVGTKGLRVETVAQSAFDGVYEWMASDATLDPYLAEHALLPLVLADSPSEVKISRLTQRFMTQVWVIKQLTPARIVVRGVQDTPGVVSIAR